MTTMFDIQEQILQTEILTPEGPVKVADVCFKTQVSHPRGACQGGRFMVVFLMVILLSKFSEIGFLIVSDRGLEEIDIIYLLVLIP